MKFNEFLNSFEMKENEFVRSELIDSSESFEIKGIDKNKFVIAEENMFKER